MLSSSIPLPDFDNTIVEPRMKKPKRALFRTQSCNFSDKQNRVLPVISQTDAVPRITCDTMNDVLNGVYNSEFKQLFIIDCRFPYEYEGGHIKNAKNSNSPTDLFQQFFEETIRSSIIIFHCEFSQSRGPTMAGLFRDHDRNVNWNLYPFLYYPDVYILDGGYKEFYEKYPNHCDGGYMRMHTQEHVDNGNLQHYNTIFRNEIEKINEKKREVLLPPSKNTCPISPLANSRKRSSLIDSPIATKKRSL
ncbi:Rhodanese-like domain containing protein [Trichomonas vaginalis G3]|uniref:protein-tyrosine-phosphatase n=1 Tax=Trichomonas vaginalis (strain ATCC PRA-98 / G3) TaxID=412133 RepID=A2F7A4_TRIV3|nr:positive regulation of cell cycle G2/M phase transition [Trichomonas vaginalis G3]EAX99219.1 Rhodanese-like domain containing protein [Trichomonas vaginalis G3]KAI5538729.1 positive regulation of cell cycle G2/M phase transition [Trichomonas vaginalis G3]|eukprot:XP_001312149.1 Rhodanese-like domain containing protein [Trichomonas vaginalis G3]